MAGNSSTGNDSSKGKVSRRSFLKSSAVVAAGAAAVGAGTYWVGSRSRVTRALGKKVIVIGIDGMDPVLCESMMKQGQLPNFAKLRAAGTFSRLGTSIPPQSPVAWANFINGAGPGSHGIFDFIHRHPGKQCDLFFSASEVVPGDGGGWQVGDHKLPRDFWPFNDTADTPTLRRQGTPFWDFLDKEKIPSTFYDLPSNYPPSPSQYGHHRCLCGMGTPDLFGTYGTYQHFADSNVANDADPFEPVSEGAAGKRFKLTFHNETAKAKLLGPTNSFLQKPKPVRVEFEVHRDRQADAAVVDIQGHKIVLKSGQWSAWTKVNFELEMPWFMPNKSVSGVCRFYLQEVEPNFKLYLSPINIDPSAPAVQVSEPASFVQDMSGHLGLFATAGFQEAYNERKDGVFRDDEYLEQANNVLHDRLQQFQYAIDDFEDGLFYFYFSSSDLQSHMFWWWNSDTPHPLRDQANAEKTFGYVQTLYRKLDKEIGEVIDRYGNNATIMVMSDHGFGNFGRQFSLNTWLREEGYLAPPECTSILDGGDVDWSKTRAYGIGINGLYLNLKGRERDGIVEPGEEQEALLKELIDKLEAVTDPERAGQPIIRNVYRADKVYPGNATFFAPDLVVGYRRGFRASWETCDGHVGPEIFMDNTNAWQADHCIDALEVPGILFSNRSVRAGANPSLVDVAPSILAEFGLPTPATMTGKSFFVT